MLTGRPARLVSEQGAVRRRHVLLVDPPVMEPASGARGSSVTLPSAGPCPFSGPGTPDDRLRSLARRRRAAAHRVARGAPRKHGPRSRVRGYRGGYLPTERRSIEHGLRDGEILGVVSTNALELGVDIGRLDVSILAGYPGSVAGTWQQFGRAGRRQGTSVAVLVASGAPVDQYVIHHPSSCSTTPPRKRGSTRITSTSCWPTCGRRPSSCRSSRARSSGLLRPTTCWHSSPRRATSARRPTVRWYWSSENFPRRRSRSGRPRRRTS